MHPYIPHFNTRTFIIHPILKVQQKTNLKNPPISPLFPNLRFRPGKYRGEFASPALNKIASRRYNQDQPGILEKPEAAIIDV